MKQYVELFEQHLGESALVKHAEYELRRAGMFDKDSDYGGAIAKAVMNIMKVFSKQGHSGFSAPYVVELFTKLASFDTLTPITDDPEEWEDVSHYCDDNKPMWQNKRNSKYFSLDGGKTWYDVDAEQMQSVQETLSNMVLDMMPIFETGDRVHRPDSFVNIRFDVEAGEFDYTFNLGDDKYAVRIVATYNTTKKVPEISIKVDFGAWVGTGKEGYDEYSSKMTRKNDTLRVVSSTAWVVAFFLYSLASRINHGKARYADLQNLVLVGMQINAKGEYENDTRRAMLYDKYIQSIFTKLGIEIRTMREYNAAYDNETNTTYSVNRIYGIQPIGVDEIARRLRSGPDRIIESVSDKTRMWALWSDSFYDGLFAKISDIGELYDTYRKEFLRYAKIGAQKEALRALRFFFNYRKNEIETNQNDG